MNTSIKIGDVATVTKIITDADIQTFADLIGDHNSVHLDDEFERLTEIDRTCSGQLLTDDRGDQRTA